jgi:MoaA/NifB/PqqE/SkfB family radical SAM enzyme
VSGFFRRFCLRRQHGTPAQTSSPEILNLELSYACNLRCWMCPRSLGDTEQGFLPPNLFERLKPALGRLRYVHLSGFGEPLLYPQLTEIVRATKAAGCHVSFTTNGTLLSRALSEELLGQGIDAINVSIDAGSPQTYENVRGAGRFAQVLDNLRHFVELRQAKGRHVELQWVFLMMKSTIEELPGAVQLAAQLGCERLVAKHMETALSQADLAEALFNTGIAPDLDAEIDRRFRTCIAAARSEAGQRGIDLFVHPRRYRIDGACLAQPLKSLFIDFEGNVSECCYLNVRNVRPYMTVPLTDTGTIGNLSEYSLDQLLQQSKHLEFLRQWQHGEIPAVCRGCLQVTRMHLPDEES